MLDRLPAEHRHSQSLQPLFSEVQRFTSPWLWMAVILVSAGLVIAAFFIRRSSASPDRAFMFVLLAAAALPPAIGALVRMTTEVRSDGVYVRYAPFHWRFRRFAFEELDRAEAVTYSPLMDYGGWGIRLGVQGWAYIVSGNHGVRLHMRSRRAVLIGTLRRDELAAAIDAASAAAARR